MGILNKHFNDPVFPEITYRRGASGFSVPIIKGTGLRVQTIAIAIRDDPLLLVYFIKNL